MGHFGLGSAAWTELRLLGPAWWSERAELEVGLLVAGLLVAKRCDLATTQLDSLASSIEDSGMNLAAFSCFALTYELSQPIPVPEIVARARAVANSSRCPVSQRSPWSAGAFLRDGMFWDEMGGGLIRLSVGPFGDRTTAMNTNCVDLGSFSSRCCAFRRTHTKSADPFWLLCIPLALPLTLSLPSRFAPSARLMTDVSPQAL